MQRKMLTTISNRKRSSEFFLFWIILNVSRVLPFSIENSDMIFMYEKRRIVFYILKKSSVFPRMLWRPSNLIVQFKWDTNLFKNMKKFGYWEDRAALLTYMSSTLSSDIVFLFRVPQDLRSWIWLQKGTGFAPWKKRIVRSRQAIERADGIIVTVVGDVRIESIWTSMNQDLWFSAVRCTRNHYLLSSFWQESVSLIREYTVNFTNPNDMRAENQNANIINSLFDDDFHKIRRSL